MTAVLFASLVVSAAAASAIAQDSQVHFEAVGDAIPQPLAAEPGDAVRGRSIVVNRDQGGCTLCHEVPGETRFGNVAPTLSGAGARLSVPQLRLRVADSSRVNPATPMPAYYRVQGLVQVAGAYRGKTILSAQQVEDVVAFLATLKEPK
ncbi:MAG TPA: sulfur oxidation c-type cytochrome SoxX [Burkholderiales bacterium]|nr:sulfur oxidation c-type cytochrome SoxX [Burkholderiales bacterium]